MKFVDRNQAPDKSEDYPSHYEAAAHGMCEDGERFTVDRSAWAEETGQLDDMIREASDVLLKAIALSKKQEDDAYKARFKVDVAWNCGDAGEPVLAVNHAGYAYRVDLRAIPFQNLSSVKLDRLADELNAMAEACRAQAAMQE